MIPTLFFLAVILLVGVIAGLVGWAAGRGRGRVEPVDWFTPSSPSPERAPVETADPAALAQAFSSVVASMPAPLIEQPAPFTEGQQVCMVDDRRGDPPIGEVKRVRAAPPEVLVVWPGEGEGVPWWHHVHELEAAPR
ncbi:MAG TPA: hypothetical protein VJ140_05005 [Actinomycetota bacterium]|nr:hypothetical protein [Actinomycetota bacterium]